MYPKYKYHPTKEPRVIHSAEQEDALSEEWKDSPADHGFITAPSAEQMEEMEEDYAEASEDETGEVAEPANAAPRRRGRPRGSKNAVRE